MKYLKLTPDDIEAGKSPKGGFTKKQLAKWGVKYPPMTGWQKALLEGRNPNKPGKKAAGNASIKPFNELAFVPSDKELAEARKNGTIRQFPECPWLW